MAKNMVITYAVSVTPKVNIDAVDGEHLSFTVLHEDIRSSLGGNGDIYTATADNLAINTGDPGWGDGVHKYSDSDGLTITVTGGSEDADALLIKHSGYLYDATTADNRGSVASELTDTVSIKDATGVIIGTIANSEALVIPRPGQNFTTSSTVSDVALEVTIIGYKA